MISSASKHDRSKEKGAAGVIVAKSGDTLSLLQYFEKNAIRYCIRFGAGYCWLKPMPADRAKESGNGFATAFDEYGRPRQAGAFLSPRSCGDACENNNKT